MYVGKVEKSVRLAIVNSPITIASVRNAPDSAACFTFGRITRRSVVRHVAPSDCDASVSVCTSIARKPASSERYTYGKARITYAATRNVYGFERNQIGACTVPL